MQQMTGKNQSGNEEMPLDACQFFYECGKNIKALTG